MARNDERNNVYVAVVAGDENPATRKAVSKLAEQKLKEQSEVALAGRPSHAASELDSGISTRSPSRSSSRVSLVEWQAAAYDRKSRDNSPSLRDPSELESMRRKSRDRYASGRGGSNSALRVPTAGSNTSLEPIYENSQSLGESVDEPGRRVGVVRPKPVGPKEEGSVHHNSFTGSSAAALFAGRSVRNRAMPASRAFVPLKK